MVMINWGLGWIVFAYFTLICVGKQKIARLAKLV